MGAVFLVNHFCKILRNLALDAWPAMTNGVYGTVLKTLSPVGTKHVRCRVMRKLVNVIMYPKVISQECVTRDVTYFLPEILALSEQEHWCSCIPSIKLRN